MKKLWPIILLITILSIILAACGSQTAKQSSPDVEQAPQPLLLKVAYDVAPTHSLHESLLCLEQWLEEESDGRIEVELYPLFTLGDDADMLALAAEGVIQMTLPQTSSLAALPTADYTLDIPQSWQVWDSMDGFYLYSDEKEAMAAVAGSVGADMVASLADLAGQPLCCLGYAYEGPLVIGSTTTVLMPADLADQRIAIYGSPAWLAAYQQWNVETAVLPLSEIYPALAREQITAYQATPENIATMYWGEYSTNLTLTEHAYVFRPLLVNRQWYEALSEEEAYLIDTAVDNWLSQQRTLAEERYRISIETLRQQGMTVNELTDEQQALWHND